MEIEPPKPTWLQAAATGKVEVMREMLEQQPDLILQTEDSWTALHHAANHGHSDVVAFLLSKEPKLLHMEAPGQWTAIVLAAAAGHTHVVEQIVAIEPVIMETDEAWYLFYWGLRRAYETLVERLLILKPSLIEQTAKTTDGATPLHVVARNGHLALTQRVLTLNPKLIDSVDNQGWTPLHCAVRERREPVVEFLLAQKPELIERRTTAGDTMLHLAITGYNRKEFVDMLWRKNFDALRVANVNAATPFHVALSLRHAVELFQWSLSFEEITQALSQTTSAKASEYTARVKEIVEQESEDLWDLMHRDVVPVFEYLGIVPQQRGKKRRSDRRERNNKTKRRNETSESESDY